MDTEKFYAVGMTRAEASGSHLVMDAIQKAVRAPLLTGMNPRVLISQQTTSLGPIPGFEQYWIVFFLNGPAWQACESAALGLRQIRIIPASELPPKTGTLSA
jgi:hypothetical protein